MPKEVTKYDRLKSMLFDGNIIITEFEKECDQVIKDFDKWVNENILDDSNSTAGAKKGRKRNIEAILELNEESESSPAENASETEDNSRRHCSEEHIENNNVPFDNFAVPTENNGGRSKRNASKLAEAMISKQVTQTLRLKMRRPDDKLSIQIKQEKLSIPGRKAVEDKNTEHHEESVKEVPKSRKKKTGKVDSDNDNSNVVIKKEVEDTDKPSRKPRTRARKKDTESKHEASKTKANSNEDDVIIETPESVVLTVSDSEDETSENNDKNHPNWTKKHSIVDKSVTESAEKETQKETNEVETEQSIYEDAVQDHEVVRSLESSMKNCFVRLENISNQDVNATYNINNESQLQGLSTAPNFSSTLNETRNIHVIMDNTVVLHKDNNLLDGNREYESPLRLLNENTFNMKDIQSIRNEREESEKMVPETVAKITGPARSTRTKTRALKAAEAVQNSDGKENLDQKNGASQNEKQLKYQTPNMPQISNSRLANIVTGIDSFIPKPSSAIKQMKYDSREKREEQSRKRLEKEEEVQKKKEALILKKIEEQKRKREEKALKAQQVREQLERERQLQAEKLEREKIEKKRQEAERKEAWRKEIMRKRALADKRAQENEERRRAEAARQKRLQEQEELEKRLETEYKAEEADKLNKKRIQEELERARMDNIVAGCKPKLVKKNETPVAKTKTVFNLDTDDSETEESNNRVVPVVPAWSETQNRQAALDKQVKIPNNIIASLFGSKPTCINLRDVFPNISENQLRRQSSAVWASPPRYSQIPKDIG